MPGNELDVIKYLFRNLGKTSLQYLGVIETLGSPNSNSNGYYLINSMADIGRLSSDDSSKKADVYLNGIGVSIKQLGSIFGFNRLQRAEASALFRQIGFFHIDEMLARLDAAVKRFHEGGYDTRSRPWQEFFIEDDFKVILEYLMMKGSPKMGLSKHPAKYIMKAGLIETEPAEQWQIDLYSFNDYFKEFKGNFTVGIRRSWYGQKSNSEHGRAKGLISKPGNAPWVFNGVSGAPRGGAWRSEIPEKDRKTVYYLMFETLARNSKRKTNEKPTKQTGIKQLDEF